MSNAPNYLRTYRIRSPLNQEDIAFLAGLPDTSNVSRYEKGQREPSIQFLIIYHLMFNTSIESFYEKETETIKQILISRASEHLKQLSKENQITLKNTLRIKFIEEIINRLKN